MFSSKVNLIAVVLLFSGVLSSINSSGIKADGQGKRLLALLDNYGIRDTHSSFFKSLKDRGFQLTIKAADDSDLALSTYGEYLYDHLVLFCPNIVEFGGNVSTKAVIDFIDAGGNVLVAASSQLADAVKEIAGEIGVELSDEGTFVIDRFNTEANDDGHGTLIVSDAENLISSEVIVGDAKKSGKPLLYRGVGVSIDTENPLLLEVLRASSSAFTYKPDEQIVEYPHTVGKATLLIAALQARNNARVVIAGSLDFFSNEFFDSSVQKAAPNSKAFAKSGNEELSDELTRWVFKERGVLRVTKVDHHIAGETKAPSFYTIKQDVVYSIRIEEVVNGKWQAFKGRDVQLEFIRLDPFVRTALSSSKSGDLEAKFVLPDVYGIFKFNVDYKRVGYTFLFSTTQVVVRPLEHTQYDRFIPAAFPYYASAFSMMLGVFLFSFIQLYHQDK